MSLLKNIFEERLKAFWAKNALKRIYEAIFSRGIDRMHFVPQKLLFWSGAHFPTKIKNVKQKD